MTSNSRQFFFWNSLCPVGVRNPMYIGQCKHRYLQRGAPAQPTASLTALVSSSRYGVCFAHPSPSSCNVTHQNTSCHRGPRLCTGGTVSLVLFIFVVWWCRYPYSPLDYVLERVTPSHLGNSSMHHPDRRPKWKYYFPVR